MADAAGLRRLHHCEGHCLDKLTLVMSSAWCAEERDSPRQTCLPDCTTLRPLGLTRFSPASKSERPDCRFGWAIAYQRLACGNKLGQEWLVSLLLDVPKC